MKAFNRVSTQPIVIHSGVETPSVVVVIDLTLLGIVDVTEAADDQPSNAGGTLKVNPIVSLDDLQASVRHKFEKKIGEEKVRANLEGVRRAGYGTPVRNRRSSCTSPSSLPTVRLKRR